MRKDCRLSSADYRPEHMSGIEHILQLKSPTWAGGTHHPVRELGNQSRSSQDGIYSFMVDVKRNYEPSFFVTRWTMTL